MSTVVMPVEDQTRGRFRTKARSSAISLLWAAGLGLVSGFACVGARMFFRLLQWLIVRHSGLLPHAAASLTPVHRATVPVVGALLAMAVIAMARRFSGNEEAEGYVKAVRFDHGRIAFAPTFWRTISSGFSVATGAAIGREGSMIQFATRQPRGLARAERRENSPLLARSHAEFRRPSPLHTKHPMLVSSLLTRSSWVGGIGRRRPSW